MIEKESKIYIVDQVSLRIFWRRSQQEAHSAGLADTINYLSFLPNWLLILKQLMSYHTTSEILFTNSSLVSVSRGGYVQKRGIIVF